MDIMALLATFGDPAQIVEMSLAEKMMAGLATTVLGMGVTFVALIVLQLVVALLGRLCRPPEGHAARAETTVAAGDEPISEPTVAAIATALAVMLQAAPQDLVIREIRRVGAPPSAWSRAGIGEQMRDEG
jgi:Na+-transporting methylmalonyl-CoA/oxaloacetate decarboxylase gamma subunit